MTDKKDLHLQRLVLHRVNLPNESSMSFRLYGKDSAGNIAWGGIFRENRHDLEMYAEAMQAAYKTCGRVLDLEYSNCKSEK